MLSPGSAAWAGSPSNVTVMNSGQSPNERAMRARLREFVGW